MCLLCLKGSQRNWTSKTEQYKLTILESTENHGEPLWRHGILGRNYLATAGFTQLGWQTWKSSSCHPHQSFLQRYVCYVLFGSWIHALRHAFCLRLWWIHFWFAPRPGIQRGSFCKAFNSAGLTSAPGGLKDKACKQKKVGLVWAYVNGKNMVANIATAET